MTIRLATPTEMNSRQLAEAVGKKESLEYLVVSIGWVK